MKMRTIKQALIDEVFYPLSDGLIDNKLMIRDINGNDEISKDILLSDAFKGALADCLTSVVEQAVNFSEADKSVNVPTNEQLKALKVRINSLYKAIGEEERNFDSPVVTFGAEL